MKKPYNEEDELNCENGDCNDVESCDCQGICICEPGLEIDEEDDGCGDCDCVDDDYDEFDLDIAAEEQGEE